MKGKDYGVDMMEKSLSDYCYSSGADIMETFSRFLEFVADGFDPTGRKLGRPYGQKEQEFFVVYLSLWAKTMEHELNKSGWYDALGELYERITGKLKRQTAGQFFTPPTICDLMAMVNASDNPIKGRRVGDCACGSGRNLLAFNAICPGNYMIGEDIDRTCCLMTVCNMLMHGIKGEVIWHDALAAESFFGAWRINETLNLFGIPTVRMITKRKPAIKEESVGHVKQVTKPVPVQLTLFDE